MKKSLALLLIFGVFGFATMSPQINTNRQSHLYYGESIPTGSLNYIEGTFYGIGDFDNLDFSVVEVSDGSITTMSITESEYRNNNLNIAVSTSILTSGTAQTSFDGNAITYKIYSTSANAVVYTTLNVRIIND